MTTLTEFIAARLGEREAAAKLAADESPPPWAVDGKWLLDANGLAVALDESVSYESTFPHIALHDPARTLREVEAGRSILARYEDCLARIEDPEYPTGVARAGAREYEDFVLPNLAAAWQGHPDYQQDWQP